MRQIVFLFLLCFSLKATGQTTFFQRIEPNNGYLRTLKRLSDGNFIYGRSDLSGHVVKQDSLGNVLWETEILVYAPFIFEIEEAADSGLFVLMQGGYGSGNCTWVAKLKSSGQLVWIRNYHGNVSDQHLDIEALPDTGFSMVGAGCSGYNYLTRCRANGSILWQKTYLDAANSFFNFSRFLLTGNGNFYMIAGVTSSGGISVLTTDTAGTVIWNHEYVLNTTADDIYVSAMCTTPGGIALAVNYITWLPNSSYTSPGLVEIDYFGNLIWSAEYNFPSQVYLTSLACLNGNQLITGGNIQDPSNTMKRRALLMSTDAYGQQQWSYEFSDSVNSGWSAQSVNAIIPSGNYAYIAGEGYDCFFARITQNGFGPCAPAYHGPTTQFPTYSRSGIGTVPITTGMSDSLQSNGAINAITTWAYTSCSNIITESTTDDASGEWNVTYGIEEWILEAPVSLQSVCRVELYDAQGKSVREYTGIMSRMAIEHGTLPAGIYLLQVRIEDQLLFTRQVIRY